MDFQDLIAQFAVRNVKLPFCDFTSLVSFQLGNSKAILMVTLYSCFSMLWLAVCTG
uniref:Uncharacterized protein n=1 Tax=Anguilla anguilla TaxID=7936 RepID=A0A0E9S9S9_ANGAN